MHYRVGPEIPLRLHGVTDKKLEDILEPIGVTVDEFIKICDEFTNKKLFLTDKNGKLIKDKNGNLTKINYDNVEEDENK